MTNLDRPDSTFCGVPVCPAFVEFLAEKDPGAVGAQAIARLASNVIAAVGGQVGG